MTFEDVTPTPLLPVIVRLIPIPEETFSKPAKSCAEQSFLVTLTFKKSKKRI
jgi:hypothetical protein